MWRELYLEHGHTLSASMYELAPNHYPCLRPNESKKNNRVHEKENESRNKIEGRGCSIEVCLIAWPVFDPTLLELRLNVLRYPALYAHRVHPTYKLGCRELSAFVASGCFRPGWVDSEDRKGRNVHVRCHLATQLSSGSILAMIPSK